MRAGCCSATLIGRSRWAWRIPLCKYYTIFKADVNGKMEFEQKYPFLLASVLEGDGIVGSSPVKKGDHFILPNGYGKVEMQGKMSLIVSTVK